MQYTWNDIEQHIETCRQCPLGQTRNLPVMGFRIGICGALFL